MDKKGFYSNMKNKLGGFLEQSNEINKTMNETTDLLTNISRDSDVYNKEIKNSANQVNILRLKQKREKRFFYFAVVFYFVCLGIFILRRIPFMLFIKLLKMCIDPLFYLIKTFTS